MGAEAIMDAELTALGIAIIATTESGSRKLKIPAAAVLRYEALVREKLAYGFWNEYIGPDRIHFIFKLEDGKIKEYDLSPENEQEIDTLCARLNNEKPETTANVYKYISENSFYHDLMVTHWNTMINR